MKPTQPLSYHLASNVTRTLQQMYRVLRGNVSYGNLTPQDNGRNIDGFPVTFKTEGTLEVEVNHGLGRVPVGFHVMNKEASVDLYPSETPWTSSKVYFKGTVVATAIQVTVFLV